MGRRALVQRFLDEVGVEEQDVVSEANFGPAIADQALVVATRAARRLDLVVA